MMLQRPVEPATRKWESYLERTQYEGLWQAISSSTGRDIVLRALSAQLSNRDWGTFTNPRIEAPQYINNNSNSMISNVPVCLQYTSGVAGNPQSLLYWNSVPN